MRQRVTECELLSVELRPLRVGREVGEIIAVCMTQSTSEEETHWAYLMGYSRWHWFSAYATVLFMALTKRRDEQFIFAERRASSVGIVKDTMPPKTGRGCKLSIKLNHVQLNVTSSTGDNKKNGSGRPQDWDFWSTNSNNYIHLIFSLNTSLMKHDSNQLIIRS